MLILATATNKELHALGPIASQNIRPCVTGVGILNAALCMGKTLADQAITGVINLGLAGSFDIYTVPLGSICVVDREIWPEYGLGLEDGPGKVDAVGLKFPLAELDGKPIWDSLELDPTTAARDMGIQLPSGWPLASSVTVSTVSATQGRNIALHDRYKVQLENMEGFALAYACALAGVPFLEIRAVSNLVGSRKPGDWDFAAGFAALATAASTLVSRLDGKGNDG